MCSQSIGAAVARNTVQCPYVDNPAEGARPGPRPVGAAQRDCKNGRVIDAQNFRSHGSLPQRPAVSADTLVDAEIDDVPAAEPTRVGRPPRAGLSGRVPGPDRAEPPDRVLQFLCGASRGDVRRRAAGLGGGGADHGAR